jgi:hypothetical protein
MNKSKEGRLLTTSFPLRFGRSTLIACLVVLAASLTAAAPQAHAGLLSSLTQPCDGQTMERPFTKWLDFAQYTRAPGGDFEGGAAGWTLTGGASVVSGNESFNVSGGGSHSLSLPAGSSATSPAMCVGLLYPTVRMFATRSGGLLSLSTLKVEILFDGPNGELQTATLGLVTGGGTWQPALPLVAVGNLLATVTDANSAVAIRLTPVGSANWKVDDLYVDPYCRS